jgi:hypothetical protein
LKAHFNLKQSSGGSDMPKTCFVIGPIGNPETDIRTNSDDLIRYIIAPCPALKELGYDDPIRADQLSEPGRITSQIIKFLMEADLVIADMTTNNPNVYYELSLRHALGKPVIHMALEGTSLSFDIRDNRTIFYTMHSRTAEAARAELDRQIRYVNAANYKPMNPILETVGIVSLERSADPQQNAIGKLAQTIQGLAADLDSLRDDIRLLTTPIDYLTPLSTLGSTGILAGGGAGQKIASLSIPPGSGKSGFASGYLEAQKRANQQPAPATQNVERPKKPKD